MVKAQEWLDENYPKEEREGVKELDVSSRVLKDLLGPEGFINLEKLNCSNNFLNELDVSQLLNLNVLSCSDNFFIRLDLTHNKKLRHLDISNNFFTEKGELTFLSHLVNLEILYLGNNHEESDHDLKNWYRRKKFEEGVRNRFTGNLNVLKNLTRLKKLDISNTDIDSGLEFLPASIEFFNCSADQIANAKAKTIETELKKYGEPTEEGNFVHLLKEWRKNNVELIKSTWQNKLEEVKEELEIERKRKWGKEAVSEKIRS